jgi:Domain of unknown function (DUF4070)
MIDTVHLKYRFKGIPEYLRVREILERLELITITARKINGDGYINAEVRNLKLNLDTKRLWIKGSLPKFYLGDNIHTLTFEQIRMALRELSDILSINIFSAELRRVDVSHRFFLKYPVEDYLNCFEKTPGFRGFQTYDGETLTYIKENYSFVLYDKIKESKKKGDVKSLRYSKFNVLRVELQLMRRIASEVNRKTIYAAHLLSHGFLAKLIKRWMDCYSKIYTRKLLINRFDRFGKNHKNLNFIKNIDEWGGRSRFHEMIDRETRSNRTSPNQRKYFRKLLKNLRAEKALFYEFPILVELNSKVKEHYLTILEELESD